MKGKYGPRRGREKRGRVEEKRKEGKEGKEGERGEKGMEQRKKEF